MKYQTVEISHFCRMNHNIAQEASILRPGAGVSHKLIGPRNHQVSETGSCTVFYALCYCLKIEKAPLKSRPLIVQQT